MINKLNEIASTKYNNYNDILKLVEETTELNEVLIKFINKNTLNKNDLADEIADVEIMLNRIKFRLNIDEKVLHRKHFKIKRQLERLK